MAGLWELVVPEQTTNLIINPIAANNVTDGWTLAGGGGATLARDTSLQFAGEGSFLLTRGSADCRAMSDSFTLADGKNITVQVRAYSASPANISLLVRDVTNSEFRTTATMSLTSEWEHLTATWENDTGGVVDAQLWVRILTSGSVYFDLAQSERKAYSTMAGHGDLKGWEWTGEPHNSTSIRSAQSRQGGRVRNFDDYYLYFVRWTGFENLPYRLGERAGALLDGASFTGAKALTRRLSLSYWLDGTSLANLHSRRKDIMNIIGRDYVKNQQPWVLRYNGANSNKAALIDVVTESVVSRKDGFTDVGNLIMRAFEPFFREEKETAHQLNTSATLAVSYVMGRESGTYVNLDNTGTGQVRALEIVDNLKLYVGGQFLNWDSQASADNIAFWNFETEAWGTVGTGANSTVKCLEVGPDGTLYIGGAFTSIDGTAVNRIAAWDGSSITALGTGMNNDVEALHWGPDGNLYAGGAFTTAGGTTVNYIAYWDGSAWNAMDSGTNGDVFTITSARYNIIVGGTFTTVGAGAASAKRVAEWSSFTLGWSAMGGGMDNGIVYALESLWGSSLIFAGGSFTSAEGDATIKYFAFWNGTAWINFFDNPDDTVYHLYHDGAQNSPLWVSGDFASIGTASAKSETLLADRVALFDFAGLPSGNVWRAPDFDLPGSATVYETVARQNGDLYFAFTTVGDAIVSQVTAGSSVNNTGTARAYPTIAIKRSGGTSATLVTLRNETTGATLNLDYDLADGETLTMYFEQGNKRFISSQFGNVLSRALLRSSDLNDFFLLPGENDISALISVAGAPTLTAYMLYNNRYTNFDGVA